MAAPRPPQAGDPPRPPLDTRGDRRHTRAVEHVSTCQTPRARRFDLRALTPLDHPGPTTLPHHPPEGNHARQDFSSTMNTTISPAAFTPPRCAGGIPDSRAERCSIRKSGYLGGSVPVRRGGGALRL